MSAALNIIAFLKSSLHMQLGVVLFTACLLAGFIFTGSEKRMRNLQNTTCDSGSLHENICEIDFLF